MTSTSTRIDDRRSGPGRGLLATLLLAFVLGGCAVAPAQEMSEARLAVQAAMQAGAERYSNEWLAVAGGELAAAEHAIAAQDFDVARQHARIARGLALAARNMALLATAPGTARIQLGEARAMTTSLVDASRRASASGDDVTAARLADQAARVSGEAAAASPE